MLMEVIASRKRSMELAQVRMLQGSQPRGARSALAGALRACLPRRPEVSIIDPVALLSSMAWGTRREIVSLTREGSAQRKLFIVTSCSGRGGRHQPSPQN